MFENLISQIQDYGWFSIVVGLGAAFIFYFLGKKTSEKHSENLKNTQTTVTESQETINKINDMVGMLTDLVVKDRNQGHSQGKDNAPAPIKSINDKDEKYKEKTLKCRKLLEDVRWTWRTDVMLMRESGLTDDEFNNFVRTDQDIVKSKINDINGNRLFSLRNKLS